MIEGQLDFLKDEEKTYAVRICSRIEDVQEPVPGSIVKSCEGCEHDVWYDPRQMLPIVRGVTFEREVVVCIQCGMITMTWQDDPIKWMG